MLKATERIIHAGYTALRAKDGTPLPKLPQYKIVHKSKAGDVAIVEMGANDRLVMVGTVLEDRAAAVNWYEGLKAGTKRRDEVPGTPIYIIVASDTVDQKTGMTKGEFKACDKMAEYFLDEYSMYQRERKARKRQGGAVKC
jgi:hypothetical protein